MAADVVRAAFLASLPLFTLSLEPSSAVGSLRRGVGPEIVLHEQMRFAAAVGGTASVSPAMRCVSVLTILFFSVYLMLVLVRSCGRVMGWNGKDSRRLDQAFAGATEAMAVVPMLCLLLIAARVRAMHIDPTHGYPQPWAQVCMYITTWAFLVGFALQLLQPCVEVPDEVDGMGRHCAFWVLFVGRATAALVLYGGCTAILVSIFVHRSPLAATPPMYVMTQCVLTLLILYLAVSLVLAALQFVRRFKDGVQHRPSVEPQEHGGGFETVMAWREREGFRQHGAERITQQASLTLHFAPMICILLMAISLRALQLGVQLPFWALVAMHVASWGLVLKVAVVLLVPILLPGEMVDVHDDTRGLDWSKHTHPTLKCLAICLAIGWRLAALLIHIAMVVIIFAVFVSESDPAQVLWPELWDGKSLGLLASRVAHVPRISTAMRCVMGLNVLYFAAHLVLSICRAAVRSERAQQRLAAALEGVEHSLAFVPMLCVIMVCVRMRAVQLHLRDPPTLAQVAMYFATVAVTLQVLIAVLVVYISPLDDDNDDFDEDLKGGPSDDESAQIRTKLILIGLLCVRYLLVVCLYVAMGVVVISIFSMEKDSSHSTLDIRPDASRAD